MNGIQQGDPLVLLRFSLALRPLINELMECLSAWKEEADALTDTSERHTLVAFYMDEGAIMGFHHVLQKACAFFDSTHACHHGLFLGNKC